VVQDPFTYRIVKVLTSRMSPNLKLTLVGRCLDGDVHSNVSRYVTALESKWSSQRNANDLEGRCVSYERDTVEKENRMKRNDLCFQAALRISERKRKRHSQLAGLSSDRQRSEWRKETNH